MKLARSLHVMSSPVAYIENAEIVDYICIYFIAPPSAPLVTASCVISAAESVCVYTLIVLLSPLH